MSLRATHFPDAGPGFNHEVAEAVVGSIMKMDVDSARMFATMLVGGAHQYDLMVHDHELATVVRKHLDAHADAMRSTLTRAYLAKRAGGGEVTSVLLAAEVLAKAIGSFDFTPDERAKNAAAQQRDLSTGQFVRMHHNVSYPLGDAKPMSTSEAKAMGIPTPQTSPREGGEAKEAKLTEEQRLHFQTAYAQVAAAIRPFQTTAPDAQRVLHLNYDGYPEQVIDLPARGEPIPLRPRAQLKSAAVSVIPSASDVNTSPYDTLRAMGVSASPQLSNDMAARVARGQYNDDFSGGTRAFNRLQSTSSTLDTLLGDGPGIPDQLKMAIKVGQAVGVYGPEAQRVIGPTVDRAAYRYRGTERVPDKRVTEAFATATRQAGTPSDSMRAGQEAQHAYAAAVDTNKARHARTMAAIAAARSGDTRTIEQREIADTAAANRGVATPPIADADRGTRITAAEAHRRKSAADGRLKAANKAARTTLVADTKASTAEGVRGVLRTKASARRIAIHGNETDAGWAPSAVLSYFKTKLPNPDLNSLHLKSGTVPPSEGVMLDRRGQLVTQAVGYGDDWYLPFNLKHLSKLKGGEYIRTRTWGGPTTEDLYTGLAAGAKSLTVVSHNGVYNIEFDPSFKGGRRYNDKAARMVSRYGHLLDTVRNGQVTAAQLDPSVQLEIESRLEADGWTPDTAEYKAEGRRQLASMVKNPKFTQTQRAAAASEFLDAEALKQTTTDGHEATGADMVNDWLDHQANTAYVAYRASEAEKAGPDFRVRGGGRPVGLTGESVAPAQTLESIKAAIANRAGITDVDQGRVAENAIVAMGQSEKFETFVGRQESTYRDSLKPMTLDGPGYERAMQALQEQFPYYIKSATFHPWADAKRGTDSGYVNPGANRPDEAEAGYFAGVGANGVTNGKVRADSIRFQGGQLKPESTKDALKRAASSAPDAAPDGVSGVPGRSDAPAVAPARQLTPADAKAMAYDADLAVLTNIWDQKALSGLISDPGGADLSQFPGRPVGSHMAGLGEVAPNLAALRSTDLATWTQKLNDDPEGTHKRLAAALRENDLINALDLDKKLTSRFHNGGLEKPAGRFDRNDPGTTLRTLDAERSWGSTVYDRGDTSTAARINSEYRSQPTISAGVAGLGLPTDLEDPEFTAKMTAATNILTEQDSAHREWLRGGSKGLAPKGRDRFVPNVEALARAKQLSRRYDDATEREAIIPSIGPGAPLTIGVSPAGAAPTTPTAPAPTPEPASSPPSARRGGLHSVG